MKTVLELNKPVKTRKPPEVRVVELKAEVRELKRQLKMARTAATDMLADMRRVNNSAQYIMDHFAPSCLRDCTCTPSRADFLRAIARDP